MKPENNRPVSIEDLLRLKRLERPAGEFWTEFDRQLRAKQLSALVEMRPWWQEISLAGIWSGLRRYHLPLGAASIVAATVVSYEVNRSQVDLPVAPVKGESVPQVQGHRGSLAANRIEASAAQAVPEEPKVAAVSATTEEPGAAAGFAAEPTRQGSLSGLSPFFGVGSDEPSFSSPAAGTRYLESTWSGNAAVESMASPAAMTTSIRFEARSASTRAPVEPLQQIMPPSERRGVRILTAMVSMASVESAMRTTERAASRLSEEQLYDQIHRFGARGAGVNLKF